MTKRKPLQLRLPEDLKTWLKQQAAQNGSSQNSEIVRAVRERADRMQPTCAPETVRAGGCDNTSTGPIAKPI